LSSAYGGLGDAGNGRSCGWSRSTPGNVLSTVARSVASLRGCGHGYAMAGGEMLRSRLGIEARGRTRRRGEGRRSSQRFRRVGQWARGEAGASGAAVEISGVGRLKMTAWRRSGASGVA